MADRAASSLPIPGLQRSWWLREALAHEGDVAPAPAVAGEVDADVAIVGGGYTGMWAAYLLAERAPGARIVLLDQDICGGGPSGRNGGFVHGWWENLPDLAGTYGDEAAVTITREADEVVDGIGAWCTEHGVDAWFIKAGYLRVNAFPNRAHDWDATVSRLSDLGVGAALEPWDAAAVHRVCASPSFGDGLWMPSAASIQPARLARGMRRVLIERGVAIHEQTRVRSLSADEGRVLLTTDGGRVVADQAVLAINAWASGWPGFRSRVLAWGS